MQGAQVRSLIGELTSHMLPSLTKKKKNLFLKMQLKKKKIPGGTSLVVQWLGFCTFIAKDAGSIPGQGARIL